MTLGELRAMADRELLTAAAVRRAALADVRSLVPAPAVSAGGEVTIAGRAFTLGAVYAPRRGKLRPPAAPAAGLQPPTACCRAGG